MTTSPRTLGLRDLFLEPGRLVERSVPVKAWLPWLGLAACGYFAIGVLLPPEKMVSVPLLAALATLLGGPTLYIFDALAGSRLRAGQVATICLIALVIPGILLLGYLLPLGFLGSTLSGSSLSRGGARTTALYAAVSAAVVLCSLLSTREVLRLLRGTIAEEESRGDLRQLLHRGWMLLQLAIVAKLLATQLWS